MTQRMEYGPQEQQPSGDPYLEAYLRKLRERTDRREFIKDAGEFTLAAALAYGIKRLRLLRGDSSRKQEDKPAERPPTAAEIAEQNKVAAETANLFGAQIDTATQVPGSRFRSFDTGLDDGINTRRAAAAAASPFPGYSVGLCQVKVLGRYEGNRLVPGSVTHVSVSTEVSPSKEDGSPATKAPIGRTGDDIYQAAWTQEEGGNWGVQLVTRNSYGQQQIENINPGNASAASVERIAYIAKQASLTVVRMQNPNATIQ